MPAPVYRLLYCTTVLFKVLYCKIKNVFKILFFMYYLCEKYYKSITVQYYIADCVSWVSRLTLLDLMKKLDLRMRSRNETRSYVGDLLYFGPKNQTCYSQELLLFAFQVSNRAAGQIAFNGGGKNLYLKSGNNIGGAVWAGPASFSAAVWNPSPSLCPKFLT